MLPFGIYSVFHAVTYTSTNLIPTIQPNTRNLPPPSQVPLPLSTYIQAQRDR